MPGSQVPPRLAVLTATWAGFRRNPCYSKGPHESNCPRRPFENPCKEPKPTPGFEPGTPSLRVKCSGQLSYVGASAKYRRGFCYLAGGALSGRSEPNKR